MVELGFESRLSRFGNRLGLASVLTGVTPYLTKCILGLVLIEDYVLPLSCCCARPLLIHPLSCAASERLALFGLHPGLPGLQFPFRFGCGPLSLPQWLYPCWGWPPILLRSGNTTVSTFTQAEGDQNFQPLYSWCLNVTGRFSEPRPLFCKKPFIKI